MIVRPATQADDDAIIEILKQFAEEQPFGKLKIHASAYNDHHVRKVLSAIRTGGLCLLATEKEQIVGVFMSAVLPDVWLPNMRIMNELVWWVDPQHRDSSAGLRLLKEYTKIGEKMVKKGDIHTFTLTLLETSPKLNIQKRGWIPIETNYVFGEK